MTSSLDETQLLAYHSICQRESCVHCALYKVLRNVNMQLLRYEKITHGEFHGSKLGQCRG